METLQEKGLIEIPKSVTILGRKFSVKILTRDQINKKMNRTDGPEGGIHYLKREIVLAKDLPKEEMIVTFLHECNHAIDCITGFSQTLSCNEFEIMAETRATGFYDVFKALTKKGR